MHEQSAKRDPSATRDSGTKRAQPSALAEASDPLATLQRLVGNRVASQLISRKVIEGDLIVTGNTIIEGDQDVGGSSSIGADQSVEGEHDVGGSSTVAADQSVGGDHDVAGDASVGGEATTRRTQLVEDDLEVAGQIANDSHEREHMAIRQGQ